MTEQSMTEHGGDEHVGDEDDFGPNPHPGDLTHESRHGDHVHVFEESGIEEGNGPVPRWYVAALLVLAVFFVVYVTTYFTGVQPNSAR